MQLKFSSYLSNDLVERQRAKLPNGYELSRITGSLLHPYPFHCEFAVIALDGKITYDTPLTDDVVVCLTADDERQFLETALAWATS